MKLDPRQSLQPAFQHLEAFSLPGVGTFRRVQFSAVIDHQAGMIHPPGERFVLEKGEALVPRLEDFLFRHHDLSMDRAKELLQAISQEVKHSLAQHGFYRIPGVGELRSNPTDGIHLIAMDDHGGTAGGHAHFGLQPIPYTLGAHGSAARSKTEALKHHSALQGAPVEPAPKPVRAKGRKTNRGRNVVVVLLLLVMLGSGAGMIWQDKFQGWLEDMGWIGSKPGADTLQPPPSSASIKTLPPDTVQAALADAQGTPPKNDLEPALVDPVAPAEPPKTEPKPATKPAPQPKVEPKPAPQPKAEPKTEPAATSTSLDAWAGLGEHAKEGVYYLVVGARKDGESARQIADRITKAGTKARVLVPRLEGPHYKVFVYSDRSKDKVIQKMVEWKNRFPEKSWIFWMGM